MPPWLRPLVRQQRTTAGLDAVGLAHPSTTSLADAGSAAASSLAR